MVGGTGPCEDQAPEMCVPGEVGRSFQKKERKPIPHARRLALMTLASQIVTEMALKVESHERQFFLESVDRMMDAERFQDR